MLGKASYAPTLTRWEGLGVMSAMGQKRTYAVQNGMSALPLKADMCDATRDVCFGPIADIGLANASL
jgi:hypothetical protein